MKSNHIKKLDDDSGTMTSMVDVTFLLLVFFMVVSSFQLQRSIKLASQPDDLTSSTAQVDKPNDAVVEVAGEGNFWVRTETFSRGVVGRQQLIATMREVSQLSSGQAIVRVDIDEEARLQSLVDALDCVGIAGIENVRVRQTSSDQLLGA